MQQQCQKRAEHVTADRRVAGVEAAGCAALLWRGGTSPRPAPGRDSAAPLATASAGHWCARRRCHQSTPPRPACRGRSRRQAGPLSRWSCAGNGGNRHCRSAPCRRAGAGHQGPQRQTLRLDQNRRGHPQTRQASCIISMLQALDLNNLQKQKRAIWHLECLHAGLLPSSLDRGTISAHGATRERSCRVVLLI